MISHLFYTLYFTVVPFLVDYDLRNNRDDTNCIHFYIANGIHAVVPDSGHVNEKITITLCYGVTNGGHAFRRLYPIFNGDTTTVEAIGQTGGCVNVSSAPLLHRDYAFKTSKSGTYFLKFRNYQDNYTIHRITIAE